MVALRDKTDRHRPQAVISLPESDMSNAVVRRLRETGWYVYQASKCGEIRRLNARLTPDVVVMTTNRPDESGWLVCTKLLRAKPNVRVVLVNDDPSPTDESFRRFVGAAAMLPGEATAKILVDRVQALAPAAAN